MDGLTAREGGSERVYKTPLDGPKTVLLPSVGAFTGIAKYATHTLASAIGGKRTSEEAEIRATDISRHRPAPISRKGRAGRLGKDLRLRMHFVRFLPPPPLSVMPRKALSLSTRSRK